MADLLYVVVQPSGTAAPSVAQVKAGQDGTGSTATYASSQTASTTQAYTFNATGLTAGTEYTAYFVWSDGTNDTAVFTGSTFTTESAGDALTATDISSASSVDAPALTQAHALIAVNLSSVSNVSAPVIGVEATDDLTANDLESASSVDAPALTQAHSLTAADVVAQSAISAPALSGPGVDGLAANDIAALTEVDAPALGQTHTLTALDIASLTALDAPTLLDLGTITNAQLYTLLIEIHKIMGLDANNPMTVTPNSRTAGDISQTISGDGTTSTTVTRD